MKLMTPAFSNMSLRFEAVKTRPVTSGYRPSDEALRRMETQEKYRQWLESDILPAPIPKKVQEEAISPITLQRLENLSQWFSVPQADLVKRFKELKISQYQETRKNVALGRRSQKLQDADLTIIVMRELSQSKNVNLYSNHLATEEFLPVQVTETRIPETVQKVLATIAKESGFSLSEIETGFHEQKRATYIKTVRGLLADLTSSTSNIEFEARERELLAYCQKPFTPLEYYKITARVDARFNENAQPAWDRIVIPQHIAQQFTNYETRFPKGSGFMDEWEPFSGDRLRSAFLHHKLEQLSDPEHHSFRPMSDDEIANMVLKNISLDREIPGFEFTLAHGSRGYISSRLDGSSCASGA